MYINVVQCNVLYFQIVIPWRQTLDHSVPLLSCIAVIFIIIVVLLLFSVIVTIPFSYYLDLPVSPEVTLFQKDSGVVCHSTGFYPDGVVITWKRDGEDMHKDVNMWETLPNEDGTFQKRAELTVSPEERKKGHFTCEVAHKSGKPIVKTLIVEDGKNQHLKHHYGDGPLPCYMLLWC